MKLFSVKESKNINGKKTTINITTEDPQIIKNLLDSVPADKEQKKASSKKDSIKAKVKEVKPKTTAKAKGSKGKATKAKAPAKPKALPAPSNKKKELTGKMLDLFKKIEKVDQEQKKLNHKVFLNAREVFDKYDFWKSVEKIPHSSPTGTEIHYYKFNDAMLAKLNKRKEFKESFSKLNDNNKLLEGYYKKIRNVAGELKACFKTVLEYEAYCNKNIVSEVSKIRKYS